MFFFLLQCCPIPIEISESSNHPPRQKSIPNHNDPSNRVNSTYQNLRTRSNQDLQSNHNLAIKSYQSSTSGLSNGSSGLSSSSNSPDRGVMLPINPVQSQSCPSSPALVEKAPKKSKKLGFKMSFKRKHWVLSYIFQVYLCNICISKKENRIHVMFFTRILIYGLFRTTVEVMGQLLLAVFWKIYHLRLCTIMPVHHWKFETGPRIGNTQNGSRRNLGKRLLTWKVNYKILTKKSSNFTLG